LGCLGLATTASAEVESLPNGGFACEIVATVPDQPGTIYDALTGDISSWWDHTMSENPLKLYLEAKPGGGFWEIFDAEGNGVRHAVVTFAQRGKRLRFEGPLGLSGHAILMVTSYDLAPARGDSTQLTVTVHASGEILPGWPEIVEKTWHHFVFERFVPHVAELAGAD
jgi:hypothetical protein